MLEDAIDMAVQHQNTMMAAKKVAAEIQAEIDRAVRKFPTWPTDPLHALAVLGEEYGELNKAVLQLTYEPSKAGSSVQEVRKEAIQTAAMALRFVMSLDKYQYGGCEQHHQGA
jgi:NTP pyrophosphatase (non-canonical NTP hydrolase)